MKISVEIDSEVAKILYYVLNEVPIHPIEVEIVQDAILKALARYYG